MAKKSPTYLLERFEDDPEILAMSDEELVNEALAAAGMWADRDDINDDSLSILSSGWAERIRDLYAADPDLPV